jgi:flagellar hook-basal body complex protein FliE
MSNMQIDSVLAQIRSLQAQTRISPPVTVKPEGLVEPGKTGSADRVSFANVLKQGLDAVNATQAQASSAAARFDRGEPGLELSQVMLEANKAQVAFRATVEVRNRLVNAYQEIMNMPI